MKILINTPSMKELGGVANHYLGLRPFWTEKVRYNTIGRRRNVSGALWLPWDVIKYISGIIFFRPDIVLLNPSLASGAVKRDSIFLKIAKSLRRKTVVFFHGWNYHYYSTMDKRKFVNTFNKTNGIIVLASEFRTHLTAMGINVPIYLSTTKVDDNLVKDVDLTHKKTAVKNILFLSRIIIEKGIYIAIEAFKTLSLEYPFLELRVVGDGPELNNAKELVKKEMVTNVTFTGNLTGKDLINEFRIADVYILPSYGEGMPTSVLEAMAFGLPVVTRPVGGLKDFFQNGIMGYMTESFEPKEYCFRIRYLIEDPSKVAEISSFNYHYAQDNFMASKVSLKVENILRNILNE